MPKAMLTFDLPAEQDEFDDALQGQAWHTVVFDLDQELRNAIKHDLTLNEAEVTWRADMRAAIRRLCDDHDVRLD